MKYYSEYVTKTTQLNNIKILLINFIKLQFSFNSSFLSILSFSCTNLHNKIKNITLKLILYYFNKYYTIITLK